jgi:type 1 fimbriae regulatory protein FimE
MTEERWPVHPKPIVGELLTCWLKRIAAFYGLEAQDLLECDLGFPELSLDCIENNPPGEFVEQVARRTGLDSRMIWSMTCAPKTPEKQKEGGKSLLGKGTIPPAKTKNIDKRPREFVTIEELEQLIRSARQLGTYGDRDALLILMGYRHALRVGEVVRLRWEQVDLQRGTLHIERLKNGVPSVHHLEEDEIRSLRRLRQKRPNSGFVFTSQRNGPLSARQVRTVIAKAGRGAGILFPVHPHMLRHGKGHELARRGMSTRSIQLYMGHKNVRHTASYTGFEAPDFTNFGRDVKFE